MSCDHNFLMWCPYVSRKTMSDLVGHFEFARPESLLSTKNSVRCISLALDYCIFNGLYPILHGKNDLPVFIFTIHKHVLLRF